MVADELDVKVEPWDGVSGSEPGSVRIAASLAKDGRVMISIRDLIAMFRIEFAEVDIITTGGLIHATEQMAKGLEDSLRAVTE